MFPEHNSLILVFPVACSLPTKAESLENAFASNSMIIKSKTVSHFSHWLRVSFTENACQSK
jgi:hypothetical protein